MRPILAALSLISLPLIPTSAALAQEEKHDPFIVGIGVGAIPSYEGSAETSVLPIPGALGKIGGFSFLYVGNRLSVDMVRDAEGSRWDFQLGPSASVGFSRSSVKNIEDERIRALGKIGTAVELGGYAGVGRRGVLTSEYDRLSATVTWRHDVAGGHRGTIVTPSLSYMAPVHRKAMVVLVAAANHVDDNYAGTYFSITPTQSAASGLETFTAESGWKDWMLGAAGTISLTGDLTGGLSLLGGLAYTRLLGDVAESPVVSVAGSRDQWMAGVGLAYTF